MALIGVDLGGTKILVGVLEGETLVSKSVEPTPKHGWKSVLDKIAEMALKAQKLYPEVKKIGVGCPGPLDFRRGEVKLAPNVFDFKNVPLVRYLEDKMQLEVMLENDANAAGLAEAVLGAARGTSSSIYITVSTGIGGGLCFGDRVWRGFNGIAGEVGHIISLPGAAVSGAGQSGALEALCSGRAIARDASFALNRSVSTAEAFKMAQGGDSVAVAVVENALTHLGVALANLQKTLDPEVFVIGGGVAEVGDYFFDFVRRVADASCAGYAPVVLHRAQMGYDAGVIGAALSSR